MRWIHQRWNYRETDKGEIHFLWKNNFMCCSHPMWSISTEPHFSQEIFFELNFHHQNRNSNISPSIVSAAVKIDVRRALTFKYASLLKHVGCLQLFPCVRQNWQDFYLSVTWPTHTFFLFTRMKLRHGRLLHTSSQSVERCLSILNIFWNSNRQTNIRSYNPTRSTKNFLRSDNNNGWEPNETNACHYVSWYFSR